MEAILSGSILNTQQYSSSPSLAFIKMFVEEGRVTIMFRMFHLTSSQQTHKQQQMSLAARR